MSGWVSIKRRACAACVFMCGERARVYAMFMFMWGKAHIFLMRYTYIYAYNMRECAYIMHGCTDLILYGRARALRRGSPLSLSVSGLRIDTMFRNTSCVDCLAMHMLNTNIIQAPPWPMMPCRRRCALIDSCCFTHGYCNDAATCHRPANTRTSG